jgi:acyl-CoA synthetase (AMP-forming)/AMP-acid ligase II
MNEPSTLIELVSLRSIQQPLRRAYTILSDGETEQASITYSGLEQQAKLVARWLQARSRPGERVLLLLPTGLDYITSFLGCIFAGLIPVPAYPRRHRNEVGETRIEAIARDARPSFALTNTSHRSHCERRTAGSTWQTLPCHDLADIAVAFAPEWEAPKVNSDTPAFIQYTSGSTTSPRGVVVSHGSLLQNERMIEDACGHDSDSTFVGWLPLYHDMGLVGNVLQSLYIGAHCILMSPSAFVQKPIRWLRAISTYRCHTSGGPNFAYDLCVRKISPEECEYLDLSTWSVAFNGAEPVRYETINKFSARFRVAGFRESSFMPCYGLAEASLIVACKPTGSGLRLMLYNARRMAANHVEETTVDDPEARTFVSCGKAVADTEIAIVDPTTLHRCSANEIGEIWLRGLGIATGYWDRGPETEMTFEARLAGDDPGHFLRTGDLGFIKDGELFVTGRIKDLIVIRGVNHYAEDIEWSVRQREPLVTGCAAFCIEEEDEEKLVVAAEVSRVTPENGLFLTTSIRRAVSEKHQIETHRVVLLQRGALPYTSSGKIQRSLCKEMFVAGTGAFAHVR